MQRAARRTSVLLTAMAVLCGGRAFAATLDQPVRVDGGLVTGRALPDSAVRLYAGIPYAAAPVRALRWRPPQPAAKWRGVRAATQFSPVCPQPVYEVRSDSPPEPQSEDCLYLNVWTAAKDSSERRPVMVWIFGGGFREGSASRPRYDGAHLAAQGVVYVNFNYRLGALGFLAHPQLSHESDRHVSGNYGALDMIALLRWVRANIAAFGGDPDRVTIFGQSAGSMATNLLTASPLAKGLFQRVIGQSGAALGANVYTTLKPLAFGEQRGVEFTRPFNAVTATQLRALPVETLVKAQSGSAVGLFDPVIDGWFLQEDVRDTFEHGRQNDVPTLVGSTTRESSQLPPAPSAVAFRAEVAKCYPHGADLLLGVFPAATDSQAKVARETLANLLLGSWSMRGWARLQKATGSAPVYLYSFERAPPVSPPRGTYHGADLYYSFDNLDLFPLPWSAVDRRLAEVMSSYWVNFATSGNPNGPGLPVWPVYDASADEAMVFGTEVTPRPLSESIALDLLDRLKAAQRQLPPEQRC